MGAGFERTGDAVGKRRRVAVAAAVAALAAAGISAYALWPSHRSAEAVAVPPTTRVTSSAPVVNAPRPDLVPHDYVAPAVPTSFELLGPGFRIDAHVCPMDFILPLDPPGDQVHTVCWVQRNFGVAPGSDAKGTSYILGHAWAEANLVLNPLSTYATKHESARPTVESGVPLRDVSGIDGSKIVLKTRTGTLTYVIGRVFAVSKENAIKVASIMATGTPNRVVVITCGVLNGIDVDDNIVVYADLVESVST